MISLFPEYTLYAKTLIGLLAIVDPLGAIPIYLALCGQRSITESRQVARTSAITVAVILIMTVWTGDAMLSFFGINISSFRAGGGLLILLMSINMLQAKLSYTKQSPEEVDESNNKENIAVVPLALPLLAGPGAMGMVIINAHQAASWVERVWLCAVIAVVALIVWLVLRLAAPIGAKMGLIGLNIATRVLGMLLAAIGIQMITSGLIKLLPGLA